MDLERALAALPADPRIVVTGNHAIPWHTLKLVDAALDEYRLWVLNGQPGLPDRDGVTLETSFVGAGMRRSPRLSYVPSRLSMVPTLFARQLPPDAVVLHTTRPRRGQVSLGVEVNVLPAALEAVRRNGGLVVAQVNDRMPWTYGDALVDLDLVDVLVEADGPLPTAPVTVIDEASARIGRLVAERVPDGATIQAGIGAVPDATMRGLTGRSGLRVWTEMFSDSVLELEKVGALDRNVAISASFLFGSPELLDWVDGNERVEMLRTEVTNSPALIARNPSMVSVNTALQVDLFGQANASRINARIHSGFGGQTDFIVGAMHSAGGQAFIALRSWHPKADCSTVVPLVDEPVTSFQMSAIVTEQGLAEVFGRDQHEQARQIIEHAAHPSVRDELWEEAVALGLGPRAVGGSLGLAP
ncbi:MULTISPECIES: acetyl-CoA hydrolase/transferase family protein [unclassified Nocardioides]|uniref:acetyl-CoA hydrolase/transferase family protein n=1 Tax=unclassified Nocardioides TaxID=2615069 RepID=UPI0009F0369F|nr:MULTISPECIES: acetyl-CoA hydrolase/transferase C-terminal domain-containing protein [unclassified Nocardioides]GAW50031.1 acetyl-CoA hydrolase/transferase [Nocardioides sp. PD653-B2]GAW55876.1 acetyl-CoA hydrolase/transferase [Nocardioides sp. PD653]